jgi:hypothetical protein
MATFRPVEEDLGDGVFKEVVLFEEIDAAGAVEELFVLSPAGEYGAKRFEPSPLNTA